VTATNGKDKLYGKMQKTARLSTPLTNIEMQKLAGSKLNISAAALMPEHHQCHQCRHHVPPSGSLTGADCISQAAIPQEPLPLQETAHRKDIPQSCVL
jgi:hypothetical protein